MKQALNKWWKLFLKVEGIRACQQAGEGSRGERWMDRQKGRVAAVTGKGTGSTEKGKGLVWAGWTRSPQSREKDGCRWRQLGSGKRGGGMFQELKRKIICSGPEAQDWLGSLRKEADLEYLPSGKWKKTHHIRWPLRTQKRLETMSKKGTIHVFGLFFSFRHKHRLKKRRKRKKKNTPRLI